MKRKRGNIGEEKKVGGKSGGSSIGAVLATYLLSVTLLPLLCFLSPSIQGVGVDVEAAHIRPGKGCASLGVLPQLLGSFGPALTL